MKKIVTNWVLFLFVLLVSSTIYSQANGDFRSKASGNWNSLSTWQTFDGTAWVDATSLPDTLHATTIISPNNVTYSDSGNVGNVTIQSGATLTVSATTHVVMHIVTGGMDVYGTLVTTGTPRGSAPYSINVARDTLVIRNGGVYQHDQNAGGVPTARWETGSTILYTGVTGNTPANSNQNFYNVTWNCPNQTANLNLGWGSNYPTPTTIYGNVNVLNTKSSRFYFCAPTTGTDENHLGRVIVNIMGDVNLVSGNMAAHGTGNSYTHVTINTYGNVTASSGNLSISRGSQGGTGYTYWNLFGNLTLGPGVTTQNSNATGAFWVCKKEGSIQTLTIDTTATVSGAVNWQFGDDTVYNYVDIGDSRLGGSGTIQRIKKNSTVIVGPNGYIGGGTNTTSGSPSTFQLSDGGELVIASPDGIRATGKGNVGAVRVSGTRTYGTGAGYYYRGSTAQVTGSGLPSKVGILRIDNPAGVTIDSTSSVTVDILLDLLNGKLNTGSSNVAVNYDLPSAIRGGGSDSYVVGSLKRAIATTGGEYSFPIGSADNYRGAVVYFTSNPTSAANITASYTVGDPGANGLPLGNVIRVWKGGYWTLSSDVAPGGIYSLSLETAGITDIKDINAIRILKKPTLNDAWAIAGTANSGSSGTTVTERGISGFSIFGIGGSADAVPVELSSFSTVVNGNSVDVNWITQTETNVKSFEIQRIRIDNAKGVNNWETIAEVKAHGTTTEANRYSYTEKNVLVGSYNYRLKMVDNDGTFSFSKNTEVVVSAPSKLNLSQNYPNPFNPVTVIKYELNNESKVSLCVYNMLGEKVVELVNESQPAGTYEKTFNASNLASGIYIYQLNANNTIITKRMILLK